MRPFSYPEVIKLNEGESCLVNAPVSEVKRKVGLYSTRANKRFAVTRHISGCTHVQRFPVTDTELHGVG